MIQTKLSEPVKEGFLRFVCLSDTHNKHLQIKDLPKGDVLLHAGDFTYGGEPEHVEAFTDWLGTLDYKYKIVIAGNHEITFDLKKEELLKRKFFGDDADFNFEDIKSKLGNCIYLEDSAVVIEGIKIYGTPHQPWFHNWAFNRHSKSRKHLFAKIPSDTDILLTHGPPYDILDFVESGVNANVGCPVLSNEVLNRIKPKYHVFGHIHEANGVEQYDGITFINAAICNVGYKPENPINVFDLPINGQNEPHPEKGGEEGEEKKNLDLMNSKLHINHFYS